MRHHVAQRKLGVKSAHRQAMLANLACSLILNDKIETTLPRAKELRRIAERIVTLCKDGSVHAARQARSILRNRSAVQKAFGEFKERFEDRQGGYTRIMRLGFRHGDSAPMAIIEYLPSPRKAAKDQAEREAKEKKKAKVSLKEKVLGKAKAKAEPKVEAKAKEEAKKEKKAKTGKTTKKSLKK